METLLWIIGSGIAMTALALVGSTTLLFSRRTLDRLVLPLVAFAAGSLLGGAFFHMIPAGLTAMPADRLFAWTLGGFAVAGTFVIDIRLGITTWLAAAAHEVPQELGDFGVLVHAGWSRGKALLVNALSASTFLIGGVLAYAASFQFDVGFLVPFAAGNFIYIGASDLVPEVNKHHSPVVNLVHFVAFVAGVALLWAIKVVLD